MCTNTIPKGNKMLQIRVSINTVKKSAPVDVLIMQLSVEPEEYSETIAQFEESLKQSTIGVNEIMNAASDMPIQLKLTLAEGFALAVGGAIPAIILKTYLYLFENDDQLVSFKLESCLGKKIIKIDTHQMFKPKYN